VLSSSGSGYADAVPWLTPDEVLRTPNEQLAILMLHEVAKIGEHTLNLSSFEMLYLREHTPPSDRMVTHYQHDSLRRESPKVSSKLAEAWAWLEQQRYLVPDPYQRPGSHFRSISDRGKDLLLVPADDALRRIRATHLLGDHLHPRIEAQVRGVWNAGDFATAVFKAGREVEIAVGEALPSDQRRLYGVDVVNAAFGRGKPLSDPEQDAGEQEGTRALFAGFIATFKNPGSHRHYEPDDPIQAAEIINTADLLIRMLYDRFSELSAAAKS
jgi:uncharacterized protein (TIGR02391 family)